MKKGLYNIQRGGDKKKRKKKGQPNKWNKIM